MKFRDFFLPKIAHSKPEVRIAAIETEENVELLKKVIENDSDQGVVKAAKNRLTTMGEAVL